MHEATISQNDLEFDEYFQKCMKFHLKLSRR